MNEIGLESITDMFLDRWCVLHVTHGITDVVIVVVDPAVWALASGERRSCLKMEERHAVYLMCGESPHHAFI